MGTTATTGPTLVAVGHGTRDPEGAAAIGRLLDRVRVLRPGLRVEIGCLDLLRPTLTEVLAGLRGTAVLVPLLLGAGYHVHTDIPDRLAHAPHLRARVAGALGPDPLLAAALADRLTESGWPTAGPSAGSPPVSLPRGRDAVVLAAAGSSDPRANAGTERMASLLASRLGRPVVPSYLSAASPSPAQAVADLRERGFRRVAVARYLIAPGHFARSAGRSGGCVTSPPLGAHDDVARLVLRRYDDAGGTPR
ncbi:sirohydrochlorin chelatase [Streptomyces sp. UNOC14_S4]|uniref:sirohydrochlorin chelatase n=1 Tax=Streptomyces sp. UNOC14_S4 TaxID=2872340 RepID=UPI001E436C0C|nr:sirohydrochlorin chelatase [Streptomyces sp. UNOC14_S4]MCC3767398.1 sirohydrochlorin chelatase [Streptomyces sp. UNOC14_S4]